MPLLLIKANDREELFNILSSRKEWKRTALLKFGEGDLKACFVYQKNSDLPLKFKRLEELLKEKKVDEVFSFPDGIFLTRRKYDTDSIAFLFPGQGSQYRSMLKDYLSYDIFRSTFEKLNTIALKKNLDLRYLIYGEVGKQELNDTQNAQPALAAMSWSLVQLLEVYGIKPYCSAGHSFGELVALASAGCYDHEFLMELSLERGRLMARASEISSGKMLALVDRTSTDWLELHKKVEPFLGSIKVELANINTHGQLVYSGGEEAISKLKDDCSKKGIKNTLLNTSAAFHSSLMKPISREYQDFLKKNKLKMKAPLFKVYSNLTNNTYEVPEDIVDNLSEQLTNQVDWVGVISQMYQNGIRLFFEVGPRTTLSKMVRELTPEGDCLTLALDGEGDFESLLALAVVLGLPVTFPQKFEESDNILDLESKNKVVSGFLAKQKMILDKIPGIADLQTREEVKRKLISDTEDVLEKYYSLHLEDDEELRTGDSEVLERNNPLAVWIRDEVARLTGFDSKEITFDSHFDSDLSLDSITKMELFSNMAAEYGTQIGDVGVLVNVSTINELVRVLESKEKSGLNTEKMNGNLSEEQEWIREEISRYTGINANEIGLRTRFTEDLMLDSIMKMDLFSGLQKTYPHLEVHPESFHIVNSLTDIDVALGKMPEAVSVDAFTEAPKKEKVKGKNFSTVFRERLAFYLGIPSDQIQTTSNFEHDLKLNVFEKEDLVNSLMMEFPYFQLAGRQLLNTQTVGDLLDLESIFDRRSKLRSGEEEVGRYRFVRHEIDKPNLEEGHFSNNVIFCPLLIEKGFEKINEYLAEKTNLINIPVSTVSDVGNVLKELNKLKDGDQIDLLFLLAPLAKLDLKSWEIQMEKYISFLYNFSREIIHIFKKEKPINIKLLVDGSRDAFAKGTVGFFRSLVREIDVNVHIVDMAWEKKSGAEIPWGLLWDGKSPSDEKCKAYTYQDRKYYVESLEKETSGRENPGRLDLPNEPNILLLGGGRGITAEMSKFFSESFNAKIFAVGRTSFSGENLYPEFTSNKDLRDFLKEKLDEELSEKDQETRNRIFNSEFDRISKQREIWQTKESVEKRGGEFHYFKADVRNFNELRDIVEEIEKEHGSLDGLIHAPGLIQDNLLEHKEFATFEKVVKTKVQSAFNLYSLFKNRKDLSFACFFSSLSSWSGAPGQTDYSLANEILNVLAEHWNKKGHCPVSSLLWSVWTETGLASSSLVKRMSLLKLGGISNRAGVRLFKEELLYRGLSEPKVLFSPESTLEYSLKARAYE